MQNSEGEEKINDISTKAPTLGHTITAMTAAGTRIVDNQQSGTIPGIMPTSSSESLALSPTDSQVTFGAPETPVKVSDPGSTTQNDLPYLDLQNASLLHDRYPTVFSMPNGMDNKYSESWCEVCGVNVEVSAMGMPTKFFNGAVGLYDHILNEHFNGRDAADYAAIVKKFKCRRISQKDQDLISEGDQPNTAIVMRVPWFGKMTPNNKQAEKRAMGAEQEGDESGIIIDSEMTANKRRRTLRTTAIAGNQNRQANLKKNPYRNMGSHERKKTSTKKQTDTEQANPSVSHEQQSNTEKTMAAATPEQTKSPKIATPRSKQTHLTPVSHPPSRTSGRCNMVQHREIS